MTEEELLEKIDQLIADRAATESARVGGSISDAVWTVRQRVALGYMKRHAATGIVHHATKNGQSISFSQAQSMVESASATPGPRVPISLPTTAKATEEATVGASTGWGANIAAFFQGFLKNIPTLLTEIEADIGPALQFIAGLQALGL